MKLSAEQIKGVNKRLIDFGFTFIDIRIEVLDHILCLVEEKENLDFEQAVDLVFEEQKEHLKSQKLMQWSKLISQRISVLKDIFLNPMFSILWILSFFIYSVLPYESHKQLVSDFAVMPISLPILSYVIFGIYLFRSKNKATSTFGAFFSISFILMFYLYFGIKFVRNLNEFPSLLLLSGFTAVSMMLYYLLFYYKRKNEKKFKTLLNS